jgi:hypothetical protein
MSQLSPPLGTPADELISASLARRIELSCVEKNFDRFNTPAHSGARKMADLAEDNERLTAMVEEMREQLAGAASDKASVAGRLGHLMGGLAGAREETAAERRAA